MGELNGRELDAAVAAQVFGLVVESRTNARKGETDFVYAIRLGSPNQDWVRVAHYSGSMGAAINVQLALRDQGWQLKEPQGKAMGEVRVVLQHTDGRTVEAFGPMNVALCRVALKATEERVLAENVSPREGCLPRFARVFLDAHGGQQSLFVRATSDYFTMAIADVLLAHKLRGADDPVAYFAPKVALDSLTKLLRAVYATRDKKEVALTLLNEAFGGRPQGTFSGVVDGVFQLGFFAEWVTEFEKERYASADRLVDRPASNSAMGHEE